MVLKTLDGRNMFAIRATSIASWSPQPSSWSAPTHPSSPQVELAISVLCLYVYVKKRLIRHQCRAK